MSEDKKGAIRQFRYLLHTTATCFLQRSPDLTAQNTTT